jgi:hypothetical protein
VQSIHNKQEAYLQDKESAKALVVEKINKILFPI